MPSDGINPEVIERRQNQTGSSHSEEARSAGQIQALVGHSSSSFCVLHSLLEPHVGCQLSVPLWSPSLNGMMACNQTSGLRGKMVWEWPRVIETSGDEEVQKETHLGRQAFRELI